MKINFGRDSVVVSIFVIAVVTAFFFILLWSAPTDFSVGETVRISDGAGLNAITSILSDVGIIRSEFWFKVFIVFQGGSRSVKAGDYYFDKRENVIDVARRVSRADFHLISLKVTIPEGYNVFQIAVKLQESLSLLVRDEFVDSAPEGYLFPDTYFFLPNAEASDVIDRMRKNFDIKMESVAGRVASSTMTIHEIVTLASIVEKEAAKTVDRKKVAWILIKRLDKNFPLQIDAAFTYVNGKNTYTLTKADLGEDSPYNTYLYSGLPPTPISNPGLDSILAVLEPEETQYFYFLSDLNGNIYYAEDFEGHQKNREKYLRK